MRSYQWVDAARQRPVWTDVWHPVAAAEPKSSPLLVLSHGAFGSARNYRWLAESLARRGSTVLGVSHYGESWLYGGETVRPAAASEWWTRPTDCTFALDRLLDENDFAERIDPARIGAIGHSSGGATAISLAGAVFDPDAMMAYARSEIAKDDRGCDYARDGVSPRPTASEATASHRDPRVSVVVAMDPALGPGFTSAGLSSAQCPVLVIGSVNNDFLPFEQHAGRFAAGLPAASLVKFDGQEGHFVYLDCMTSGAKANGVPLYVDREGVDRAAVHAFLEDRIASFLEATLVRH